MRFYKPGQTQYQSQFAPLNLDFMQKNLAQKEENDMLTQDLLDKTGQLQVEGGMLSDPNEVKKYNDWIQTNTAAVRDKFYAGELDAREAARNLSKITQFYNTNEDIKFFNTDKQLSAATRARIAQGKANGALSSNISYLDGELSTTPLSSKAGLDALARGHNLTNPTGIYDKENYQHQLDRFVADTVSSEWDSAPKEYKEIDGVNMLVTKSGGKTKEQLTRDKILQWGLNVAEQEFRNSNTPFIQYQKYLASKYGYEYTPEQFATDAANAYTGYYTKDVSKSDSNYAQLSGGSAKEAKPEEPSRSNPGAGATVDYGIDVNEVLNDPEAFNFISKNMGELKNFDMRKMNTPGTKEYEAVSRRDINNLAVQLKQPSKTSPTFKKRLLMYVKNSKNWGHLAGAINGDYEIPKGTLRKLYAEFATSDFEFKEDRIRTQNTDRTIAPGSAVWEDYVGVDKGAATITNMVTQARLRRSTVYSEKLQRTLTDEELVKLHENNGTTPVSGISETTPENVLTFMTGDDNFIQGINFATADDVYTINKTTTTKLDAYLNSKYREGVLNRGEWLNYGGGIKYKILKPVKGDTEVKIDFKLPNNQVIQLNSIAEFEKQREASNITVK